MQDLYEMENDEHFLSDVHFNVKSTKEGLLIFEIILTATVFLKFSRFLISYRNTSIWIGLHKM